jgi:peptide/nickel transport system permease protein
MLVVGTVALCAVIGPWIAPGSPDAQQLALGDTPPTYQHLAGTDALGRDVFSRVVYGARTALIGPAVVAALAYAMATVLGLLAGYFGGIPDTIVMRWVDFMFALPEALVAIVVVGVIGGGYWTSVLVLAVLFTATATRVIRAAVIEQRSKPYIDAARMLGVAVPRILFVHIFPNVRPIVGAYAMLDFAFAFISLAGLSFLGLGAPPGSTDWGRMVYENRAILFTNPAGSLLPTVLILLTAAGINLIGDWLAERPTT